MSELSNIPHQLEYLIEEALPYDAYTFIEELESGKVEGVLQVLFLSIIHALNISIIYQSGESNELREYLCKGEDSFDSKDPIEDHTESPNINYYVFVCQDGTSEVYSVQNSQNKIRQEPIKAHSFQTKHPVNSPFPQRNTMSVIFDSSQRNSNLNHLK